MKIDRGGSTIFCFLLLLHQKNARSRLLLFLFFSSTSIYFITQEDLWCACSGKEQEKDEIRRYGYDKIWGDIRKSTTQPLQKNVDNWHSCFYKFPSSSLFQRQEPSWVNFFQNTISNNIKTVKSSSNQGFRYFI